MPYFFMLSGYLYKRKDFYTELSKSFGSLIVPYLCFNAILLFVSLLVGDFQISMIKNNLLCNYELFPVRYFSPLWFLMSLYLIRLFCSIINERYYAFCAAFFLLLSLFLFYAHFSPNETESDYFQLATTCICLPSFLIGYMLKRYNVLTLLDMVKPILRNVLLAVLLCGMLIIGRLNGFVIVFKCTVGKDIFIYYVVGTVMSIIIMYILSKFLNKENKIIKTISTGTILILGLHVAMIDGIGWGLTKSSVLAILVSVVIMVVCYVLIVVTLKYFPFLVSDFR